MSQKIKNFPSLLFLAGLSFLVLLFSIYLLEFNSKIDSLYFQSISNQPLILEKLPPKQITLIFVGDIMLDRGVKYMIERYGQGDYKFPFLKIANHLNEADILFGNLEGPISDQGVRVGSIYSFRKDPKSIEGLVFAGFDILAVANNHIFDYGRRAMEDTFLRLKEAGIDYVGGGFNENEAYSPKIKEMNDTKIAFLAYTNLAARYWLAKGERSGIAWLDEKIADDIRKAKEKADIVIVSMHFGEEYRSSPTLEQRFFARLAIDSGADLVVGHHPHVIQEIEKYNSGYIAYSLGNFIFDQAFSEETMKGLMLKVLVENNKIKEVIPIEVKINQYFQPEIPLDVESKIEPRGSIQKAPTPSTKPFFENLPDQLVNCFYRISGVPSPKGIAFSPDGQEFWVTSLMNKARGVVVFDSKTGKHKKDIVLPGGGGVEIIFNASGSRAFVSQMETGRVFEIDAETKEILRAFDTKSSWTKVLALSPTEDFLYASNWSGNNVSIIDLESGKVLSHISTVFTPRGIYVTKDGSTLYVAGFANGEIQKINLQTGERLLLHRSGGAMRHIVGDEEKGILYVSDMGKGLIFKVDIKNNEVKEFVKTDTNPNTIALTPDKNILIVSNRGRNHPSGNYNIPGPEWGSILFFDTSSGKMLDALVGGNQPTGLAVSPDGRYFVYSNFLDGNLTMCEIPPYEEFLAGGGGRSLIYHQELRK